jgi:RNA polymerase sigma factor (sigma-70 family)
MSPPLQTNFDAAYIDDLCNGVPAAIDHFFHYFRGLLTRWLQRSGIPADHSEDIQQETFARVIYLVRDRKVLKDPERLGSFVFSVCSKVRYELLRKEPRVSSSNLLVYPDGAPSPERLAASAELVKHVRAALSRMSDHDRKIVSLILMEERPYGEVASELKVNRSSFRVILHRARARLRKQLQAAMEAPPAGRRRAA